MDKEEEIRQSIFELFCLKIFLGHIRNMYREQHEPASGFILTIDNIIKRLYEIQKETKT